MLSCNKEAGDYTLNGTYYEPDSKNARSALTFLKDSKVVITEGLNAVPSKDTDNYKIKGDSIYLWLPSGDQNTGSRLYFKLFKGDSLHIGNIYASIPEAPPVILTFKK